jgi:two-component system cell cycle sensor histidine kinase/response regulator CckA
MPAPARDSGTLTYADALALLDVIPDGLIVADRRLRCRFANTALATFLGRGGEEVLGHPVRDLLGEPGDSAFAARLDLALAERRDAVIEWMGPRGQPMTIHVLPRAHWLAVLLRRGGPRTRTGHQLDGRIEARLLHAQRLETVGRMAGGVAHDFNNLLTIIQNYCRFVAEELPAGSAAHADMEEVRKATASAADLTRQLLAFSRKQELQPRRHDVKPTIMRVVGMLRRVLGEDIRIETELPPYSCSILADPGQVEQVLMNLAVNARDAMPHGGSLRIRARTVRIAGDCRNDHPGLLPGSYISVEVQDTGVGIRPERLPQIFEPYYTTKGDGSGLGLALVRGIAKQSGGDVLVESSLGQGSRFTVLLPYVDERDVETLASDATTPVPTIPFGARGETILVVEDEPQVRGTIRRLLETLGYVVHDAATGEDAVRITAALPGSPDLVLVDMVLPDKSGPALSDGMLRRWPTIKVLFMSGYTDEEIRRRGVLIPGAMFLEKPFTREDLAKAVRAALDGAAAA